MLTARDMMDARRDPEKFAHELLFTISELAGRADDVIRIAQADVDAADGLIYALLSDLSALAPKEANKGKDR